MVYRDSCCARRDDVFAAQAQGDRVLSMCTMYVISLCDNVSDVQANIYAAQAYVESGVWHFKEACVVTFKPQPPNFRY